MKQSSKILTIAIALLGGIGSTAMANGTYREEPVAPSTYTPAPAPAPARAPEPYRQQPVTIVTAVSPTGPYISASIGIGIAGDWKEDGYAYKIKNGMPYNVALGYNFGSTRLEAAGGYQKHDWRDYDEDVTVKTLMGNGYYDFGSPSSGFRPYLMAGAGIADVRASWDSSSITVFAWQAGAGVGVKLGSGWTFDIGYRYLKPSSLKTSSLNNKVDWELHNVLAGFRYQF
ncbi:MAG TPA: outer membrane beta-barrel protein [Chlorobaculum sp.]|nr:outer membrane beta-barrel protein [Chlorobaculum sp.]